MDRAEGHGVGKYCGRLYAAWEESRSLPEQLHILDNLLMINEGRREEASYNHLSPVLSMHSINKVFIIFFKDPLCKTHNNAQSSLAVLSCLTPQSTDH